VSWCHEQLLRWRTGQRGRVLGSGRCVVPHELVTSTNSTSGRIILIYCGIDWAERTHDVALVDDSGQLLTKRRITDDATSYKILLDLLAEYGDSEENPVPVAIETSRGLLVSRRLTHHQSLGQEVEHHPPMGQERPAQPRLLPLGLRLHHRLTRRQSPLPAPPRRTRRLARCRPTQPLQPNARPALPLPPAGQRYDEALAFPALPAEAVTAAA
jgi:hypothetical protein